MTSEDNIDRNLGEKMMGEEVMRTVEFLRGRLLAERVASRKAKEAAQLMGNKLVYLETKLKEETKSRNKAEKRLKFLKKKLMECMNVSLLYVSDESENSSYVSHGEVSSIPYSSTKDSPNCYQEMEKMKTGNDSSESLSGKYETKEAAGDAIEEENMMSSLGKANLEFNGNHDLSMPDGNSRRTSQEVKEMDAENNLVREENVDDSLAIVAVEMLKTKQTIDPDVLDETVREVLGSLRRAKEKLQNQMEKKVKAMSVA
ncbi:PREDICTED: uncharacterized protein LOC109151978 isoform X2 [Ipomoea nil]|uniref:uncharacterized protein LOC109151978 isoform X2 n=1 Tax=Ipomoea nil TaxID=35883 RepID=UPI000900C476|nr:PREDICTED: uncharacterized protein LOC109151978 isoform X2 [Ipomoea nil]